MPRYTVLTAMLVAGCTADAPTGDEAICSAAAEHAAMCTGGEPVMPEGCDPILASQVLEHDCHDDKEGECPWWQWIYGGCSASSEPSEVPSQLESCPARTQAFPCLSANQQFDALAQWLNGDLSDGARPTRADYSTCLREAQDIQRLAVRCDTAAEGDPGSE